MVLHLPYLVLGKDELPNTVSVVFALSLLAMLSQLRGHLFGAAGLGQGKARNSKWRIQELG